MSLYSVTEDLKQSLSSARRAILGRGGEISATAGLKDLPEAIYKIPADASLAYQTDDSVVYRKIVPSGAEEYAQVAKVGGMTHKVSPPFSTLVDNGMGTINTDGSITVTNTSEEDVYYNDNGIDTENVGGKYFALSSECPYIKYIAVRLIYVKQNQETGNFDVNEVSYPLNTWIPEFDRSEYEAVDGRLDITIAANAGTVTFTPILADTDDLVPKLLDTNVTELVSEGANLLPRAWTNKQTINGITYTVMDDNTIVANGTATAESNFSILRGGNYEKITLEKGGTYTLSGCASGGSSSSYRLTVQDLGARQNYNDFGDGATAVANYTEYYAFIRIYAGYTANNLVFKPMFVRGSTAKPYSPFGTIVDTFPIPEIEGVTDSKGNKVEGIGRGVSGYPNYIDFERKVFVQRVKEVDMGLLNWGYRLNNNRHIFNANLFEYGIQGQISPDIPINALAQDYRAVTVNAKWVDRDMAYNSNTIGNQTIEIVDNRYTNQTDFKAAVSGKKLLFAVETPVETDISTYLTDDNFIEVEGGGVIKAVNEHEQDAPSTINYITKVGA
jgi:hypothetical protein